MTDLEMAIQCIESLATQFAAYMTLKNPSIEVEVTSKELIKASLTLAASFRAKEKE